ncbi:MAG: hypothetical protein GY799_00505 [Desulfobulbaceae bacterium]|nr:hypothetical protein [Desulfobulbaceae bacterium]
MKIHDIELVEEDGKFYIVELNKRGCYRQKKDVTSQFLKLAVDNLNSSIVKSGGKSYLTAIREMDREQKAVLKMSKKKKQERATESWEYITGALTRSLFGGMFSELKNMYRI